MKYKSRHSIHTFTINDINFMPLWTEVQTAKNAYKWKCQYILFYLIKKLKQVTKVLVSLLK